MKRIFVLLLLLLGIIIYGEEKNDLELYTEDYPPYNFEENGKATGISVDILAEVLKEAGSTLTINDVKLVPWSRAYNLIQKKDNVMLFAMTKTKEREKLFKFFGPIAKTNVVMIAKKGRGIKINSFEDLKKYKIGTIRDDIGEQILEKKGMPSRNIQGVSKFDMNIKKLKNDRIDLIAYGDISSKWLYKGAGESFDDYEIVYTLQEGEVHYAVSKAVSDATVEEFQAALNRVEEKGLVKQVLDKYLK